MTIILPPNTITIYGGTNLLHRDCGNLRALSLPLADHQLPADLSSSRLALKDRRVTCIYPEGYSYIQRNLSSFLAAASIYLAPVD